VHVGGAGHLSSRFCIISHMCLLETIHISLVDRPWGVRQGSWLIGIGKNCFDGFWCPMALTIVPFTDFVFLVHQRSRLFFGTTLPTV
jgi:hypothetical protein